MMPATLNEFDDLLVLFAGLRLFDKIDFVLQNDDLLELHDFNGGKVLRGLWLRARLIAGYRAHHFSRKTAYSVTHQSAKVRHP